MQIKDAIEEIRMRTDIVELIGQSVALKRRGRNFLGLCPFHHEKTPSFNVSPDKQFFHCFGCGEGGSVFDFVMKSRNYSFREALDLLANKHGITVETQTQSGEDQESRRQRQDRLYSVNRDAALYFREQLLSQSGELARAYLAERGVDDQAINRYGIGLAVDSWNGLEERLQLQQHAMSDAKAVGLVAENKSGGYYDRFRHRIMFPIINTKRQVLGFGGRLFTDTSQTKQSAGKYINSPQSELFDKSRQFYLIDRADVSIRKLRQVVVVEGFMDAIAMHEAGIHHCIATLGTALTFQHARRLAQISDTVVALFDGDEAGLKAAIRAFRPLVQAGLDAKVVLLPSGLDPDTYIKSAGREAMVMAIEKARTLLDIAIEQCQMQATSDREKAAGLQEIVETLQLSPSAIQRDLLMQRFCHLTGIERQAAEQLKSLKNHQLGASNEVLTDPNADERDALDIELTGEEEMLFCLAIENDTVYQLLRTYEGPSLFSHTLIQKVIHNHLNADAASVSTLDIMDSISDDAIKLRIRARILELGQMDAPAQVAAARDCMRKTLMKKFKHKMRSISESIRLAEKQHDGDRVNELLKEKKQLLEAVAQ